MTDNVSDLKQDFKRNYGAVAASITAASAEIDKLDVDHKKGQQEIGGIVKRLRLMQARFNDELGLLEAHAEWEKFTIAFFGETNAGKSTVIESLRILFSEEARQQVLEQNARDLTRYEDALRRDVDTVRNGFAHAHEAYASDIAAVRREIEVETGAMLETSLARTATIRLELAMLERTLLIEASERAKLVDVLATARQEVTGLERTVQTEFSARTSLEATLATARQEVTALERTVQAESSARTSLEGMLTTARRNIWLSGFLGCVTGCAVVGTISFALI